MPLWLWIAGYPLYFCHTLMGCITLLTDFGLQDASVASTKGILMQHAAQCPIIDISHTSEPFHLQQAAYLLAAAYNSFARGTCHVILFDVMSDINPHLILCQKDGHYFLAPDNGLLALAFPGGLENVWQCYELKEPNTFKDWIHRAGDIIAELQTKTPAQLKLPRCGLKNAPQQWQLKIDTNTVECHVIYIDRFENVVINITREQFNDIGNGRPFRIQFMRDEEITELTPFYGSVKESEKLCRFNSTGYLEIAINRGKAASLFGFRLHKEHHMIYHTIKIFFE